MMRILRSESDFITINDDIPTQRVLKIAKFHTLIGGIKLPKDELLEEMIKIDDMIRTLPCHIGNYKTAVLNAAGHSKISTKRKKTFFFLKISLFLYQLALVKIN